MPQRKRTVRSVRLAFTLLGLAVATPTVAQYTEEQAARGRALYGDACASCHGHELVDGAASPLAGPAFAASWSRQAAPGLTPSFEGWATPTFDDVFFIMRTTMPQGAVGSLTMEQYLDVLAYILKRNGYPPSDEPLTSDSSTLKAMPVAWKGAASDPTSHEPAPAFIRGERGVEPSDESYLPFEELRRAHENARDWVYHTHDYTGRRYSDLDAINVENAPRLQVACAYQLGELSNFQTGPIVYRGTMVLTTAHLTVALDAATCRPKWQHRWEPRAAEVWNNNRGAAVGRGRVVRGTSDGYLVALDASDGRLLWARRAADTSLGETFTMAPLIYDDLILIGPAGSENAISGWVGAFRLLDGEPVWRFKTVPGAREPGDESWGNPDDILLGGGAVWTPFSLDPGREELYVAVTNPAPDLPAALRPGANLYTNSLVALDVRTGALRWYRAIVPNDFHDWDLTQVSPLFRTAISGSDRDVVATVGKDGLLRVLDRNTHESWYEAEVTTRADVDEPLTPQGVRACPGVTGGVEWNGPAYSPGTNMLYVAAVDWCSTFFVAEEVRHVPGKNYFGGTVTMDGEGKGRLTAVDASSGTIAWTYESSQPMVGAVTTTAGGLVFTGELTGDFLAFDARTGKLLLRFNTGGPIGGGIVSYEVDGKQYVAVMSGRPSPLWSGASPGSATAFVFALPSN
jgi:PQQ-dependent dehydrogenase (methanol/ethanol family)